MAAMTGQGVGERDPLGKRQAAAERRAWSGVKRDIPRRVMRDGGRCELCDRRPASTWHVVMSGPRWGCPHTRGARADMQTDLRRRWARLMREVPDEQVHRDARGFWDDEVDRRGGQREALRVAVVCGAVPVPAGRRQVAPPARAGRGASWVMNRLSAEAARRYVDYVTAAAGHIRRILAMYDRRGRSGGCGDGRRSATSGTGR